MTSQRCPSCNGHMKKVKPHDPNDTLHKCKKCGKQYIKVNRSWRASNGTI